jgi:hypothetical protein
MILEIKPLDTSKLRLIRFDFNMGQTELSETLFELMTREEQLWAHKMMLNVPNDSSSYVDEDVWDIFLGDDNLIDMVVFLMGKYNIDYNMVDISENYYGRDLLLDNDFITSIDDFLISNLTMDMVLDRINEVGISNINVFERTFLEIYEYYN